MGIEYADLFAIPEQDYWEYDTGYSYVCSSYVVSMYKKAGLFDGLSLQGTEFHPRDLANLAIYQKNPDRPDACIQADPDLPYC